MKRFFQSSTRSRNELPEAAPVAIFRGLMLLFCAIVPASANAQDALSALLLKTNAALSPSGNMPGKVTLNGTVEWSAGSTHESGTLQLKVSPDGSTSEVWSLPTQTHSITQGAFGGTRTCNYADSAKAHPLRDLNCYRAVPWFSPWLAAQLIKPGLVTALITTVSADSNLGLERVKFTPSMISSSTSATPSNSAQIQNATSVSVTYAVATGLPEAIEYDQVYDSEASHSLRTKVVFSEYRSEAGFMVPHHLQRYIQRTLQADILITSATIE